jgi:hypothetical protein
MIIFSKDSSQLHNYNFSGGVKDYKIYALTIPQNLDFCGEPVPLEDLDVYERVDRELLVNTYWQSNGLLLFKRANRFFSIIEPILKSNGVPDDFKYLALIESGFMNVVSPAGARGFWQLMKSTAKENGLEVNENVDERYHIEKATQVACKFLIDSKERFGSWTLAAASYNMGKTGLEKRLNQQDSDNYYDLLLNEETSRYLFRIIAIKEIFNSPKDYGFNYEPSDLYSLEVCEEVLVDSAVTDLVGFAKSYNISYKTFKRHNPWLRERHLKNASRKKYIFKIPEN